MLISEYSKIQVSLFLNNILNKNSFLRERRLISLDQLFYLTRANCEVVFLFSFSLPSFNEANVKYFIYFTEAHKFQCLNSVRHLHLLT